jgi:hypothetical protein
VQSMLGHASVITTELYLGIDNERRQRNEMLAGRTMFGGGVSPSAGLQLPSGPRVALDSEPFDDIDELEL